MWTETRQLDVPAAHVLSSGADVASQVAPTDTSDEPSKRSRKLIVIATGALVVVAAIAGFTVFGNSIENDTIDGCTRAVADQMKSPSTAAFSDVSASETDNLKTYHEDFSQFEKYSGYSELSHWVVTGDVDASNLFGAMVRHQFNCSAIVGDGAIAGIEVGYIE